MNPTAKRYLYILLYAAMITLGIYELCYGEGTRHILHGILFLICGFVWLPEYLKPKKQ